MAIQFLCSACGRPIEVDDEHAGKSALCPYCQHLEVVPSESTFDPRAAAVTPPPATEASPAVPPPEATTTQASSAPAPGIDELAARELRHRAARSFGNAALVCTVMMVLMFATYIAVPLYFVVREGRLQATSQPAEAQAEVVRILNEHPWIAALELGAAFFGVVGVTVSIVSLVQDSRGNWRAVLSLVLCGLSVLCLCGGALATQLLHFAPA